MIVKRFPIRPFFEKTTVQDTYKWPLRGKNDTVTFVNLNTQGTQVECLLRSNRLKDNLTTYENDYIRPKNSPPLILHKSPSINKKKPADFRLETNTTTYKEMNLPLMSALRCNKAVYVIPVKPPRTLPDPYKLKVSSEYKSSFSKKKIEMEAASSRTPSPKGFTFKGKSTMKTDYTYKKILPRILSPKKKGVLSPETRDFRTTYRSAHK
ncbi:uncharacterized protein TM35_000045250 [Trypanosoma theileri]|uniref:Uncharacterized protein n=1 Tax=Trypanosoma theileri TaxID=67003 RepID=A0A1X0P658_9TRYP|nr:uncharacterized protein TM35_000045250 [Trypanosoma theileri]ORC92311.1 hypothetical protein TM35_000045250 [Trypanosoma theileri]